MKTRIDPKFMFVIILTAVLFSCKNNQDGYNDDIETMQANIDTADTTNVHGNNLNSNNADGSNANNAAQSSSGGTGTKNTETGTGPGESAKDGSTYSGASDAQNDSISSVNETLKDKKG